MIRTVLAALAAALLCSGSAFAQHSRIVLGLHFAVPLYWPGPYYYYAYPPPPYYSPPPYYLPPASETTIPDWYAAPPPASFWYYYCADSKAYYPYTRECPSGWQRVSPTPP